MKRWIHSSTSTNSTKYVLKDLCSNSYYSKQTTGKEWSYNKNDADQFDSRDAVIQFGNDFFGTSFLYGRDWQEYPVK